jgi:hypothetical protein
MAIPTADQAVARGRPTTPGLAEGDLAWSNSSSISAPHPSRTRLQGAEARARAARETGSLMPPCTSSTHRPA